MRAASVALLCLGAIPFAAWAQEGSPTEAVVTSVKRATVFVQVRGADWLGSGSGFVVKVEKDAAYVATNFHVLAGPNESRRLRPSEAIRLAKAAKIKLVFDSGAKSERTEQADAVAFDPEADLAILRVTGLTDVPAPIKTVPPKLFETMPVFSFGFPFGKALGVGQASPAVTVGKASISSLRLGENGELSVVQIDGNLNPGNSGGPVVDAKGQLVGVAVATIRDGQGIGFVVPGAELNRVLNGSLGKPYLTTTPGTDGKVTVKVEVGVIDPVGATKGVTLHYVVVEPKGAKPAATDLLEKHTAAKHVALNFANGVATGEFVLDKPTGELFVQAAPDGMAGKGATAIRNLNLAGAALVTGSPPDGWKEFIPRDNAFSVWIPDKAKRQSERERTATVRGLRLRTTSLSVEMANGTVYVADQLMMPPTARLKPHEMEDGFRDWVASELDGKVTSETEVQLGGITGREYRIAGARKSSRVRLFVANGRKVVILEVTGGSDAVDGEDALTFLNSCRLSPAVAKKDPSPTPTPMTEPKTIPGGTPSIVVRPPPKGVASPRPQMLGFGIGPEFRELAPAGGLLVGLELGLVDDNGKYLVRVAQGIYRVGDKEQMGEKRGNASGPIITLKAKTGYAIGAFTAKTALAIDGMSVTFMKIKDGKLDPTDAYESEWAGGNPMELRPVKVTGMNGAPGVGLIGRADEKNLIAIGVVFRGQETMIGAVPPPGTKATPIHGGGGDPEFLDTAPAGGLLVGLHIGLGKFFDNDVIKALRPVYRKDSTETLGVQRGTILNRIVKVVAKPGYAVGAITTKTGLGLDGLSITFMKVVDGKLDPSDTYESDWIGGQGGGGPTKLGGDGSTMVGIVGKTNPKEVTGVGLLLRK
ncbi:MAG TPA: serine protease [Gemmataceae bacterium]|nr:serine protease [Gemmataceae bacterium]